MEKSADFIRKKEFHIVFKGYKPEEVDKFLDILSVEFDRLLKRNRELQDSLDKLKFENTEEDTDIKKVIQDALISAHKVAEDIKAQAKKEAESIIDQRKAVEDQTLHDLQMKKLSMDESLIVLQGKYDDFKNRIKKTILDMTHFIDEAITDLDTGDFTETDFAGIKYDDGEDKDQDINDIPVQKTTADEVQPESDDNPGEFLQDNGITQKSDSIESKPSDSRQNKSVFDNYALNTERESGSYFERIQKQNLEPERVSLDEPKKGPLVEPDLAGKSPEVLIEDARKTNANDTSLTRERKKIDIANPDIIENFFKASED
jgi:cell division initiation protein